MSDRFHEYAGTELELFAGAGNWKSYWADMIRPYLSGRVLEVGAGIGSNIPLLHGDSISGWTAIEPDDRLASEIRRKRDDGLLPASCDIVTGTVADLADGLEYDTILYIDVLEHIPGDAEELRRAARHLAPGGHLIVLSPAHQYLFSPFDAAIGHVRRYSRQGLVRLAPPSCRLMSVRMLDCAGFFLSLANRAIMRSSMPTQSQIAVWDRFFVPVSRCLDGLLAFRFGKTVVAVWRKAPSANR